MKTTRWHLSLLTIVFFFIFHSVSPAAVEEPPSILPGVDSGATVSKANEARRYIIKFADPPLALYSGGIGGLLPTRPASAGRTRLNPASPASMAYSDHLKQRRRGIRARIEQGIGRPLDFSHSYSVVFNGAVATFRANEVDAVKNIPGVVRVQPDIMRFAHTDAGPDWIGASAMWAGGAGTYGEGIVIGVIDSGINPENPSFDDIGGDGYDHTNPKGRFFGVCDSAHAAYDPDFPCNDKMIGAYDFTSLVPETENDETPWDVSGHGSHTAGTAAGNVVFDATVTAPTTTLVRDISGVAPHANIISYRTIRSIGRAYISVLVAAIEQAVIDGVDVINYSIGGDANNPWNDLDSEAFLAARQAGVFVVTSAGNDGPYPGSMKSPGDSPWVLTVGASTHDRRLSGTLSSLKRDGGGYLASIVGKSICSGYGPARIVYAGDYPNTNDPGHDPGLCLEPYPAGTFDSEIVVCDRGQIARVAKGENVLQGGASGYVLANDAANDRSLNADAHVLPAVHITYADGMALKDWLTSGSNHNATIIGTTLDINALNGDVMAAFSSRGEDVSVPSIIKPDVTAPGVDILAAGGTYGDVDWEVMGGTSMSSPHAAGAAALIMARYPLWTPAEIQSALMSTATVSVLKEDGVSIADPFDMGSGRIDLFAAAQAGVVLDESYENFVAADPTAGGDPSTLNLASLSQHACAYSTAWTRVLRSAADQNVQWTASVVNPPNMALTVEPAGFTLPLGATQAITIRADVSQAPFDQWLFGQVILTPYVGTVADAHFPVAVKAAVSNLPDLVVVKDAATEGRETMTGLKAAFAITDLTSTRFGLAPAEVTEGILYQDPTPESYVDLTDYLPEDGVYRDRREITGGIRRLVYELKDTSSPNLVMYLWHQDDAGWHHLYTINTSVSGNIYYSVDNPPSGWYNVYIQNYTAGDPSGGFADEFTLAIAEVPSTDSGNMTVAISDGRTSVPSGETFDLNIQWSLAWTSPYWYGAFELGTDPGSPGNLGSVDVNVAAARCEGDNDGDHDTDGNDLVIFVSHYGDSDCPGGCPGDFDHSGTVDDLDLARFAADYGRSDCP